MAKASTLLTVVEQLGKEQIKQVVTDVLLDHMVILNSVILMLDYSTDGQTLTIVAGEMGQLDVLFHYILFFFVLEDMIIQLYY